MRLALAEMGNEELKVQIRRNTLPPLEINVDVSRSRAVNLTIYKDIKSRGLGAAAAEHVLYVCRSCASLKYVLDNCASHQRPFVCRRCFRAHLHTPRLSDRDYRSALAHTLLPEWPEGAPWDFDNVLFQSIIPSRRSQRCS